MVLSEFKNSELPLLSVLQIATCSDFQVYAAQAVGSMGPAL